MGRRWLLVAGVLAASPISAQAQALKLHSLSSGGRAKLHFGIPFELHLTRDRPPQVKRVPKGLLAPLYGVVPFGPVGRQRMYAVLLDAPKTRAWRLWVDANADGDLTNDAPAEWKKTKSENRQRKMVDNYWGGAMLRVPTGKGTQQLHVGIYPNLHSTELTLSYFADYLLEGSLELDGHSCPAMLFNAPCSGDYRPSKVPGGPPSAILLVDLNGDGHINSAAETFDAGKPFNIKGTTYELRIGDALATDVKVVRSAKSVDEIPIPPDLGEGRVAPPFRATSLDGRPVAFPEDYKGKLVLLDFWATWCGPCVERLPEVVRAYGKYHSRGLEVLGVSLDKENMAEKLAAFTRERGMAWPQVYDGKQWSAAVARLYGIDGIPRLVLVDGTSGAVVASNAGGSLEVRIEEYYRQRK